MALAIFQRARQKALSVLGEGSFLNGADCGKVNLQRDVVVDAGIGDTANDNPTVPRDIATFPEGTAPKVGDLLTHPDGTYRLDAVLQNTQYRQSFIVVAV